MGGRLDSFGVCRKRSSVAVCEISRLVVGGVVNVLIYLKTQFKL